MAKPVQIEVWNPNGKYRVVSTKPMPGTRWINLLIQQDCRVEVIIQLPTLFTKTVILQYWNFVFTLFGLISCVNFRSIFMNRYAHRTKPFCLLKISLL